MMKLLKDAKFVIAGVFLISMLCIGLFADVIATDGGLIDFGPDQVSNEATIFSKPNSTEIKPDGTLRTHVLGTDQLGRDVASRLIHGIPVAFKVGILSSLISLFIAMLLGGLSGYIGDLKHRLNYAQAVLGLILGLLTFYYASEFSFYEDERGFYKRSFAYYGFVLIAGFALIAMVNKLLSNAHRKNMWVPWDTVIVKGIEVFNSIPRLFLLLAVFAIIRIPSVTAVIIVIGLIRWPSLTRIIRAKILAVKQMDYVKNAELQGLSHIIIYVRHVLPNIYGPIIVLTALNMGTAILIESSLSFLHIGLPIGEVSWGRMLGDARQYIPAWWMAVGPGLLIFSLILCFNTIGDRLAYHLKVDKRG